MGGMYVWGVCMYVCVYVCMYECMCVYVFVKMLSYLITDTAARIHPGGEEVTVNYFQIP